MNPVRQVRSGTPQSTRVLHPEPGTPGTPPLRGRASTSVPGSSDATGPSAVRFGVPAESTRSVKARAYWARWRREQREQKEREAREALEADGQLALSIGRDLEAEVFD